VLKVLLKILAMFFVFAGVAGTVVFVTCKNQASCRDTKNENPNKPPASGVLVDSHDHPGKGEKDTDERPNCVRCRDILLAWPEGITCWAVIATLIVIGWQSWETRKAAEASRDSITLTLGKERPRVSVTAPEDRVTVFVPDVLWTEKVDITVANDGLTQALNVLALGNALAIESDIPPEPPVDDMAVLPVPTILRANSNPQTVSIYIKKALTSESVPHVFYIHVFGRLSYEDHLGNKYVTTFRYRLRMALDSGEEGKATGVWGWGRCGPTEDNSAT
jgi:hypothetical protein